MILTEDQCALLEKFAKYEGISIREDYSGRGMMGSKCFGFVIESQPYAVMIRFGQFLAENEELNTINLLQSLTDSCRFDNMGYDVIVYFPRVQWMELEEEEEEEFEEEEE